SQRAKGRDANRNVGIEGYRFQILSLAEALSWAVSETNGGITANSPWTRLDADRFLAHPRPEDFFRPGWCCPGTIVVLTLPASEFLLSSCLTCLRENTFPFLASARARRMILRN